MRGSGKRTTKARLMRPLLLLILLVQRLLSLPRSARIYDSYTLDDYDDTRPTCSKIDPLSDPPRACHGRSSPLARQELPPVSLPSQQKEDPPQLRLGMAVNWFNLAEFVRPTMGSSLRGPFDPLSLDISRFNSQRIDSSNGIVVVQLHLTQEPTFEFQDRSPSAINVRCRLPLLLLPPSTPRHARITRTVLP